MYVVGFKPLAKKDTAHHMLLFGCKEPAYQGKVWNCGEMESDGTEDTAPPCLGEQKILYAWGMDAPKLELPEGVGFAVGADAGINYLTLQVHYGHVDKFLDGKTTDSSGVSLEVTPGPIDKLAGVYLMATDGEIPAHTETHLEAACLYEDLAPMHPFAVRVHAHKLGKVISGYRVRDDKWTEIAKGNPQKPQAFYTLDDTDLTIKPGDVLASRCTFDNQLDRDVYIGATMKDEMCNFYIMYYTTSHKPLESGCFKYRYHWTNDLEVPESINQDASTLPDSPVDDDEVMDM
ncbi:peptidylglycine alpha-hydroxylating monooxygenase-like [Glandiceps talaboti]